MPSTALALCEETHETKDQKRKRLAGNLRYLAEQWNSALVELLETGVNLQIHTGDSILSNNEALIGYCDVTYQTPPKKY